MIILKDAPYNNNTTKYGKRPEFCNIFNVSAEELMFCMYLPIKFPYSKVKYGKNFNFCSNLINEIIYLESKNVDYHKSYMYLTVKHLYVSPDYYGNRPGWHSDGFGTEDINYIWSNCFPTEFCIQDFDLSNDCVLSLKEMEDQADEKNIITYPECSLLKLTESVIHRVTKIDKRCLRTFIKISISTERYNLKGNAHNYLFDYDWPMVERKEYRNHTNV